MATIMAILPLALLLTGAITATAYAIPTLAQPNGDLNQDRESTQTQDRLRTLDRDGNMSQTRQRMQMQECNRDCNGNCLSNGPNGQGSPAQAENQYRNRLCEQANICVQGCLKSGANGAVP